MVLVRASAFDRTMTSMNVALVRHANPTRLIAGCRGDAIAISLLGNTIFWAALVQVV